MCSVVQLFLFAAQPTYQGEESVVILVIVLGEDYFPFTHVQLKGVRQGFIFYFLSQTR